MRLPLDSFAIAVAACRMSANAQYHHILCYKTLMFICNNQLLVQIKINICLTEHNATRLRYLLSCGKLKLPKLRRQH